MKYVSLFFLLALIVISYGACGPGWSAMSMSDADSAIAEMEAAEAEKYDAYNYHAAKLYLAKAREKNAYAQFQTAAEFAEKSFKHAQLARKKALSKKELAGYTEEELQERARLAAEKAAEDEAKKKELEQQKAEEEEALSVPPGTGLPAESMFKKKDTAPSLSPEPQGIAPVEESGGEGAPPIFSTPPTLGGGDE